MKLVSTSNFELERADSPQRSKKPSLEVKNDVKASEFLRSILDQKLVQDSREQVTCLLQESECDPDTETLAPNVEALAAAPVNDRKLIEGFELFGSVFSLLQLKQSSETESGEKPTCALEFNERNVSQNLSREDAIVKLVERPGINSVVIGFDKANKKTSTLADMSKSQIDDPLSLTKHFGNVPHSESDVHAKLKLRDQTDAQGASIIQLRPKDDSHQSAVDVLTPEQSNSFGSQSAVSVSDPQPLNPNPPRVDQIVRAVLQQSAELSGSHLLAAERQSHAGLTGQTLRLSLHPAELGGVQISVSKRGNRLQVTIVPDLESTGRLLLVDADQLVKSLGLASNNADHVQIHVATPDGSVEMQSGGDLKQTFARSENNRNGHDGQNAASHTSNPNQQESQNSDEKRNIGRKRISDLKPGGAVYI